jgi:hypothetical protein
LSIDDPEGVQGGRLSPFPESEFCFVAWRNLPTGCGFCFWFSRLFFKFLKFIDAGTRMDKGLAGRYPAFFPV